jgi:hypothetical protein
VRNRWKWSIAPMIAVTALLALSVSAGARPAGVVTVSKDFAGPPFGINNGPQGQLLVADSGAGPTRLTLDGKTRLITRLPGTVDVARADGGGLWALVSAKRGELYRIVGGKKTKVADLTAFENRVNAANDQKESNPFDLAPIGFNRTLIADAAGNSVLIYNHGKLDWVATLPKHPVSTSWLKKKAGCPGGPPDICNLPRVIPADPVSTSVDIGPDGAIYVTELTGFPATPGTSRIWRIEAGTRHAHCGQSSRCSVVARGLTSVVDLKFGPDGSAYVVELDEASWLSLEDGSGVGGTVDRCATGGAAWSCHPIARRLNMPIGVTVSNGKVYAATDVLVPGQGRIVRLG